MNSTTLFDWFIKEELRDDAMSYSKAKIIVGVGLLLAFGSLCEVIHGLAIGRAVSSNVGVFMFAVLVGVGLFLLKQKGSRALAGNWIIFFFYLTITVFTIRRGGVSSAIAFISLIFVLSSLLMIGRKSGTVWTLITAITMSALYIAKLKGAQFPEVILTKAELERSTFIVLMVMIIIVFILGWVYEYSASTNLLSFEQERDKSETASQNLGRVLGDVNIVMTAVSNGDFSKSIIGQYKGDLEMLQQSINQALNMFGDTVTQVVEVSDQLHSHSGELKNSAHALADGTTQQAASIEQITSSMGEVSSQAKQNASNADSAGKLSKQMMASVQNGNQQMQDMNKSMEEIKETGNRVEDVMKAIDNIAFQTNLLALNAAVEAARAGKYGKGFAVVADEVRNLAGRSALEAKNTAELKISRFRVITVISNTMQCT